MSGEIFVFGVKHCPILRRFVLMNKCKDCEHFIGGGDWGLCCDQKYDLVYESAEACELFERRGEREIEDENG